MAISTIIVDDEQLSREELTYLLKSVGDVEVVAQGSNGVEAIHLIREHNPELVFLDVQMPGLDGFGVIKKLVDKKHPLPQIVFATAFDQYAVRAFEVNAVDYLLKPFDKKRVVQSVEKAKQKLSAAPPSCFATIDEGVITVATSSMEGHSNCRTLEELLETLDPNLFWRAHRSHVVNINRIKEVLPWFKSSYQLRMDDRKHTELPVSRAQTKRLRELFGL
ncbi:MAG: DNA-binding response regulator [Acidobacteria bacterium]|nr:MAG: DNA-binding response regulator [Acidobacteriota bacterium]